MDGDDVETRAVGPGYPGLQLAKAFSTAETHEDEATRTRAGARVRQWEEILSGMAAGTLSIGTRAPVSGLPAWVTPEVARGGFATGRAAAGGPLLPHETATARRAGVPAERRALFYYHLSEAGLAELYALLDGGRYELTVPEEGALLAVAWLLRAGDRNAALAVLEEIEPFAGRLRFAPRPRTGDVPPPRAAETVHRASVGDVGRTLGARRPNRAVATMNEALAVWNPFADELLAHWTATVRDGRVASLEPGGWRERGAALLERYRSLAERHTLCTKHRRPRENPAILRTALEEAVEGGGLRPRTRGLLQHAVDAMIARRGVPGAPGHAALRERQAAIAARPTLHALAQVLLARLSDLPQDGGITAPERLTGPVTGEEALRTGVAEGTAIPRALRETVESALAAPLGTLVERGVVPSAEAMAELVPQLVAWTTAQAYRDEALRTLMAALYRAFRNRRSLLLLNLERQFQLNELPWVRAVHASRRAVRDGDRDAQASALVRLGELALQGFPGTLLPNPLVKEFDALARAARLDVPFVEELAADIFMGTFSPKFARAAVTAADLLEGTLYERYYGIDYAAVREAGDGTGRGVPAGRGSPDFAALCVARAGGTSGRYSVAANGMVIEQAQILTTHNLAALVHPIGVDPAPGWPEPARRAFTTVCRLVGRLQHDPRPLGTVKDAAYAWRQTLFFLALCGLEDQIAVTAWIQDEARRHPDHVAARLAPVLAGLRHVLVGGSLDAGAPPGTRRFLGWCAGRRHWILAPTYSR
ncbi:transcriptional regulator [Actinomadura viridis]|uniref:transcriptional regulator n=1 Tax=Actinomadura viridis TaxID=58110 RepID=UPI00367659C5